MNNNWGMDKLSFYQQQYLFNADPIKSPSFPQYWQYTPPSQMQEDGVHRAYNSNSPSLVQHQLPPENPNAGVQHMMRELKRNASPQEMEYLSQFSEMNSPYGVWTETDGDQEKALAQHEFQLAGSGSASGSFGGRGKTPQARANAYGGSGDYARIFQRSPVSEKSAYYRAGTLLAIAYGYTGDQGIRDAYYEAMRAGNDTWGPPLGGANQRNIHYTMQGAFDMLPPALQQEFDRHPYNIWWSMDDIGASQQQASDVSPYSPSIPSPEGHRPEDDDKFEVPMWAVVAGGFALLALVLKK